eukprot:CAMPEP_0201568410 /NCGR_PEP_ID=MMETSP0190_2-20130828/9473_1 /ASSEMBLY_ACC=CAM_ASM_000263 /TAXON_ID=37353 /ORGANISM="Rosalina sp." /LENGTH=348 /DNA_ID=CAMNT_0047989495 /DNA_START=9 /DNA_END=1051 /DNA_ORIENTATION=+
MKKMLHLLLSSWLLLSVNFAQSHQIQKSVSLNAQTISGNGALVSRNPAVATISGTTWNIQVGPQEDDYDLKLSLDSSWGFKSSIESTITIILEGYTPPPQQTPPDADLLLVFVVNDIQYFSFFLHLDIYNIKSRIFGSFDTSPSVTPVSTWMANDAIHQRWDRISNNGLWTTVHDWNKQIEWPIRFTVTSNPITGTTLFELYHNTSGTKATQWTFFDSFEPNANIDFYIMGDSTDERYDVSAVHAQLAHQTTTAPPTSTTTNPTNNPTVAPSNNPSTSPTQFPTNNPSNNPTSSPTNNPSKTPTLRPTVGPTRNPSNRPTSNPSSTPTANPSESPSKDPTISPSVFPT